MPGKVQLSLILTPLNTLLCSKTGVDRRIFFFLIAAKNIDSVYSLEPPHPAVLTSTKNLCFEQKYEKI